MRFASFGAVGVSVSDFQKKENVFLVPASTRKYEEAEEERGR